MNHNIRKKLKQNSEKWAKKTKEQDCVMLLSDAMGNFTVSTSEVVITSLSHSSFQMRGGPCAIYLPRKLIFTITLRSREGSIITALVRERMTYHINFAFMS